MGSNRSRNQTSGNWARNLLLAGVSTVLALGAAELLFRALDWRGYHEPRTREWQHALVPKSERLPGVGVQFAPSSHFEIAYDSNPRGYFDSEGPPYGLTYRINAHGFRGPETALTKPAGVWRVALIGDSFAFGEGVRFPDTMGERLESQLSAAADGAVEVLNLAVSGANSGAELSYLRHRGLAFEPDLVLWVYVLNDAGAGGLNLWEDFTQQYEARWLKGSYLVSHLYARIGRQILGRRYIEQLVDRSKGQRKKWQRSLDALSEAREVATAAGADFAVAIFPFMHRLDASHPFLDFHRLVSNHCSANGIPVLDLFDAFAGRNDTDLWVHPSDQHPNEAAHAIAADAIFGFLRAQGLAPPD
jgi:hypothetical protein